MNPRKRFEAMAEKVFCLKKFAKMTVAEKKEFGFFLNNYWLVLALLQKQSPSDDDPAHNDD